MDNSIIPSVDSLPKDPLMGDLCFLRKDNNIYIYEYNWKVIPCGSFSYSDIIRIKREERLKKLLDK